MKEKLQALLNTIQQLNIPATYENVGKIFGIENFIIKMIEECEKKDIPEQEKQKKGE